MVAVPVEIFTSFIIIARFISSRYKIVSVSHFSVMHRVGASGEATFDVRAVVVSNE